MRATTGKVPNIGYGMYIYTKTAKLKKKDAAYAKKTV